MRILGIDPSMTSTGIVLLKNGELQWAYVLRTSPTKMWHGEYGELERLMWIVDHIPVNGIDYVAMEGVAMMSRNTTALVQLSGLNYLIRKNLIDNSVGFKIIPPTVLKKFATGKGNAKKEEIIEVVNKKYKKDIKDDNACDAFILALIGDALMGGKTRLNKEQKKIIKTIQNE